MSMVLTMTTAAILAGMSLSEVSLAALVSCTNDTQQDAGLDTIFVDAEIMKKTFEDMDCHVNAVSENEIYVETKCGQLCYKRNSSAETFRLYLNDITDQEGLIANIRSFEKDYGRNVQDYTYHHIKENLADGMSIENEYFEDDDLYITINIE